MLKLPLFALLCATPALAAPSADWSAEVREKGLTAVIGALEAVPQASREDVFALAGFRFLRGVERGLQARWQAGQSEGMVLLPLFRLDLPPNAKAPPFDPALIDTVLQGLEADMDSARAPLSALDEGEFALPIKLSDLWFDVTGNGTREPGEGLLEVAGAVLRLEGKPEVTITFDRADADWLSAYTHMLGGAVALVRAFGPTPAIEKVWTTRQQMDALGYSGPLDAMVFGMAGPRPLVRYPSEIDMAAMALTALANPPDPSLTRAARDHWLAMVADNRAFWAKVEGETDNVQEWIPNPRQVSALGPALPEGTPVVWGDVLGEVEALLTGKALVPVSMEGAMGAMAQPTQGLGYDLSAWLENPTPFDLVGVAHGMAFLPYLTKGQLVSGASFAAFSELAGGNAPLFALWLN